MQPLVTDDTETQGAGHQQLEWSYERTRVLGQNQHSRENGWTYTVGLAQELDVFVAASHIHRVDAQGWGNPVLGFKWRLLETEDAQTSLALKPELAAPVGRRRETEQLGAGQLSGNLTVVLSQSTSFGAIHVNAGRGLDRFRREAAQPDVHYRRWSVAPVWGVNDGLTLAVDVGLERASQAGAVTTTRFSQGAVVLAVRPDLDWAFGMVRKRQPAVTSNAWTSGLTWRF